MAEEEEAFLPAPPTNHARSASVVEVRPEAVRDTRITMTEPGGLTTITIGLIEGLTGGVAGLKSNPFHSILSFRDPLAIVSFLISLSFPSALPHEAEVEEADIPMTTGVVVVATEATVVAEARGEVEEAVASIAPTTETTGGTIGAPGFV